MNALVIGTGVNELVCAHYLARAGHQVLVLEDRAAHGDAGNDSGWIPERILHDLRLQESGLKVERPDPWITAPLPGGGRLELWRDMARSVEAIRRVSPHDAAKWPEFCERMARVARLLETVYTAPPPDLLTRSAGGLRALAGLGFRAHRLGRQGIEDLLRLLPISAADFLDDNFESDALKGLLGAAGVMHLCQGPRSGGTAFRLLHHHAGNPPGVFRPPESNVRDVLSRLPGVEIRRGVGVARIVVRAGRVSEVVLESGEERPAALVVSGADPRRTLLELMDPGWLDPELVRAVQHIRRRGVAARVDLALEHTPGFARLAVAPSLDYLERAYDDAKHGRVSRAPYLEVTNGGKTAEGRHRLDVHVQYAPYALADGQWDDDRRRALGEIAVREMSEQGVDVGSAVITRVLSPRDMEAEYGCPEGQVDQAEATLDQSFFMRPTPELAHYRTPVGGLYLCGTGMHPGGGVAGAGGRNAAREIALDLRNK
ncbi:MAG TPA: NAD(P)/FAD-dependent oxidoreductase [Burkholderiales bacterium]|nr:NAD(P)/FAD-dependent oxidoreductase [Burkholderiales bacterium]